MTQFEIFESKELIKRFCKDYNLPINIYHYKYFFRRLSLLSKTYMPDIFDKFNSFVTAVSEFSSEQEYFAYYNTVKDLIISKIQANPEYILFNSDPSIQSPQWNLERHNLYQQTNIGSSFISIDMRKANFTSLKLYSPEIFDNKNTWEEFVGQFTDISNIIESKYVRQVILGALNPKRQVAYESYLLKNKYDEIITAIPSLQEDIYSVCADELIFKLNPNKDYSKLNEIINSCADAYRIEYFTLYGISKSFDGYKRVLLDTNFNETSSYTVKCVDADFMPQALCSLANEGITENDLTFYYNGHLARFVTDTSLEFNPTILYEKYYREIHNGTDI